MYYDYNITNVLFKQKDFLMTDYFLRKVRKNVQKILSDSGLSQQELAILLEITQPAVSNYLKGRIPPLEVLWKMKNVFHLSWEKLLGDDDSSTQPQKYSVKDSSISYGTLEEEKIVQMFRMLPPREKNAVLVILQVLSKEKK